MTYEQIIQDVIAETVRVMKDDSSIEDQEQELTNIAVQASNRLRGYDDDGNKHEPRNGHITIGA